MKYSGVDVLLFQQSEGDLVHGVAEIVGEDTRHMQLFPLSAVQKVNLLAEAGCKFADDGPCRGVACLQAERQPLREQFAAFGAALERIDHAAIGCEAFKQRQRQGAGGVHHRFVPVREVSDDIWVGMVAEREQVDVRIVRQLLQVAVGFALPLCGQLASLGRGAPIYTIYGNLFVMQPVAKLPRDVSGTYQNDFHGFQSVSIINNPVLSCEISP